MEWRGRLPIAGRPPYSSKGNSMSKDIPDEPLFALSEEDIAKLRLEAMRIHLTITTPVSDEVRRECEREMEEGRKRGWKR